MRKAKEINDAMGKLTAVAMDPTKSQADRDGAMKLWHSLQWVLGAETKWNLMTQMLETGEFGPRVETVVQEPSAAA